MEEKFITTKEAADILHLAVETVRRFVRDGKLPAQRLPGGFYRVRLSDVEGMLQPAGRKDRS
ncbi:MAG: helix-turn-helix domain-containing protein [Chloroflexi bacterium]|nr:helix-turn-helix domain-containing protein [Chloroflexota bacterium]